MGEVSQTSVNPVFVDRSGRRRQFAKLAGAVLGGLLVVALGLLGAAVSGASPLPIPGLPGVGHNAEGQNATPAATPGTASTLGTAQTPGPLPRTTRSPVPRQGSTPPVTTSVATVQHGQAPSHPAHPTPSRSK
ncbi:MAG: hypothetical protein QOE61_3444 [Micromonosporaceae bacterium]|nr:hypothetical protein [Micromonosporaceae bacterium]